MCDIYGILFLLLLFFLHDYKVVIIVIFPKNSNQFFLSLALSSKYFNTSNTLLSRKWSEFHKAYR